MTALRAATTPEERRAVIDNYMSQIRGWVGEFRDDFDWRSNLNIPQRGGRANVPGTSPAPGIAVGEPAPTGDAAETGEFDRAWDELAAQDATAAASFTPNPAESDEAAARADGQRIRRMRASRLRV